MAQIQALQQKYNGLENWQQQQLMASLNSEVSKLYDETKYPHFEAVREQMAQLLERGVAPDLEKAYEQAVWLVPEVREQLQQAHIAAATKPQVIAQAKARAVSPKSATPSGTVATAGPKDRRSLLAEQFDSVGEGRL